MEDLFSEAAAETAARNAPLAVRMRPTSLDEFVGQRHAVGRESWLRRAIEGDTLTSLILYGPPGSGKTSLARVIAAASASQFTELSAVSSGVADVRKAIGAARERLGMTGRRTILFIDEIHRFSRSQQDALLHAVEDGIVVLVGATTENPFFEVNSPLVSRSRIVELHPLADDEIRTLVHRAVADGRGLGGTVRLTADAEERLITTSGGDARIALTSLELASAIAGPAQGGVRTVGLDEVAEATATRTLSYDKAGDVHYDVVSAFIKSMRGSDPDAAVYWLARMVHGGEDPKFIARRMLVFAAEDVGNADPRAVLIAHAAVKAAEFIGWPEARINLAQAAAYLALAPKSNAAIVAIDSALREVREGPARPVPDHLRDRHRPGADAYPPYLYLHSYPGAVVEQRYLPDGLEGSCFWRPGETGWEVERASSLELAPGVEEDT